MNQLELPDPLLDPDDDGMLRMSILEHLEELRSRIIRALMGFGVAYLVPAFAIRYGNSSRRPGSQPSRQSEMADLSRSA